MTSAKSKLQHQPRSQAAAKLAPVAPQDVVRQSEVKASLGHFGSVAPATEASEACAKSLLLRGEIEQRLGEINDRDLGYVALLLRVLQGEIGCSPSRELITILLLVEERHGLTPELVAMRVEEFNDDFEMLIDNAREAINRYPMFFKEHSAA